MTVQLVKRLQVFLRSTLAGGLATFADLAVLTALTSLAHWNPRVSSIPALLVGGLVNFVGNRSFAFRARGNLARHTFLFSLVEAGTLVLNAVLFETALRAFPGLTHGYLLVRVVISNLVFVTFSYPLWSRIFKPQALLVPSALSLRARPPRKVR
jgi:putative flippase GtrA